MALTVTMSLTCAPDAGDEMDTVGGVGSLGPAPPSGVVMSVWICERGEGPVVDPHVVDAAVEPEPAAGPLTDPDVLR